MKGFRESKRKKSWKFLRSLLRLMRSLKTSMWIRKKDAAKAEYCEEGYVTKYCNLFFFKQLSQNT